jgi:hypothetical protein
VGWIDMSGRNEPASFKTKISIWSSIVCNHRNQAEFQKINALYLEVTKSWPLLKWDMIRKG